MKPRRLFSFPRLFVGAIFFVATASAAPIDHAIELYKTKRFPEARVELEKILAAEPNNAAACYFLGMTLRNRGDAEALPEAVKWLEKAMTLEPNNPTYVADFGGSSMLLAGRTRSLSAAIKGRDAMEQSIKLNPDNLDAREGLMRFYQEAPWPLGSNAKAQAQIDEIKKRNPERGMVLLVLAKANAKDYAGAFKLCDEILAQKPDNYTALYQYGRTAAVSGQNLERGLACFQQCLTLEPPGPAQPTHSNVWVRIGNIQEKLSHPAEARSAYETALKLDAGNTQASAALAALK
jgi:tetratricopeptide (TPR) repeat protein